MFTYAKPEPKQTSKDTVQKKEPNKTVTSLNMTGIPNGMKTRFENLSGFSFDDVRVHYNSDRPAQLQALAYTQGNQVYVAPGQDKHLGHELGHVVQQKQGRVSSTISLNRVKINDNPNLEKEATETSRMVLQPISNGSIMSQENISANKTQIVQRLVYRGAAQEVIQGQFASGYRTNLQTALTSAQGRIIAGDAETNVLRTQGGAIKTASEVLDTAPANITQQALSNAITKVRQTIGAGPHRQPAQGNHVFNAIDTDINEFILGLRDCMATAIESVDLSQFQGEEYRTADLARNYLIQLVEMIDRDKAVVVAAINEYSAIREDHALNFSAHTEAETMSENNDITYAVYSRYYLYKCASMLLNPQARLEHFNFRQAVDYDAKAKLHLVADPVVNNENSQKKAIIAAALARGVVLPGAALPATAQQLIANYDLDNGLNLINTLSNSPHENQNVASRNLYKVRERDIYAHQIARKMVYAWGTGPSVAARTTLSNMKAGMIAKLNDPLVREPERSMCRSMKSNIEQYLLYTVATDLSQPPLGIPQPETLVANATQVRRAPDVRAMPGLAGRFDAVQNAMQPPQVPQAPVAIPSYVQGINAMEKMTTTFEAFVYGLRSYIVRAHGLLNPLFNAEHAENDHNPVSTLLS